MKVVVEGNALDMSEEDCKTDKSIIDALLPFYPAVGNATIKRAGKGADTIITVTKKAKTKGSLAHVIEALDTAPESINPVLAMSTADPKLITTKALDNAILKTLEDEKELTRILDALHEAQPQSAVIPPRGF